MLHNYQREELRVQAEKARHNLASACPLLEDEVAWAAYIHILELEDKVAELDKQLAGLQEAWDYQQDRIELLEQ